MLRALVVLQAAVLVAGTAIAQCSSLTTQTTGGNGQNGTTFDIVNLSATAPVVITNFDQCWFSAGTSDIAIYTKTGTSQGFELSAVAWTLLASTTGVVHGVAPTLDPIPLTLTLTIPPSSTQGFYITSTNGNTVAYTTGSNHYTTVIGSDANIQVRCGLGMSYPFGSGFGLPTAGRIWNGRVSYCVAGTGTVFATATSVGTGCVDRASATFYETFASGTFDLSNTSIMLLPSGNGYVVTPGGTTWWTPVGSNLALGDDAVSAALPLGFTLNYPGGSTTDVYASSNGFVWAQSNTANGCCTGDPAGFIAGAARWSPLWNDLNPSAGGTVIFDQDLPNGAAYLTYTAVPEYGTSNLQTFQVAFFSSGIVEIRWQACSILSHQMLVGWTPGLARDPGSVDISASLPIITQPDLQALRLTSTPRPIGGTTINLTTGNITPTAIFGAVALGFTNPNLPLAGIGMPGCTQYADHLAVLLYLPMGAPSVVMPFGVPNLVNLQIALQSFLYDPAAGATPVGATASNGLAFVIGDW
jgi:hypothetical protein